MKFENFEVLSSDEIDRIIDAAFDILDKAGCRFDSGWSKKQLKEAGCRLDDVKSIIHVPRELMEKFLDEIPRLEVEKSYPALHLPGAARTQVLDLDSGQPRPASADDAKKIISVFNTLDNIYVATAGVMPTDVPQQCSDAVNTGLLLQYSNKPFAQQPYSRDSARVMIAMAEAAYGGREEVARRGEMGYLLATTGPLRYTRSSLELARMYAGAGLPVVIGSKGRMGREAPATPAGALTLLVAEFMAGVAYITASDVVAPVAMMDGMRAVHSDGRVRWSGSEQLVRMLGAQQIADRLGFPISPFAAESDFHGMDFLVGLEKASYGVAGLNGIDKSLTGAGNLPEAFSLRQLVLDNDLAGMARSVSEGVEVNDETLAVELIKNVGPGGSYFEEEHTRKHLDEKRRLAVMASVSYRQWLEKGSHRADQAAGQLVAEILSEEPSPVIKEEKVTEIRHLTDTYIRKIQRRETMEED